LQVGKGALFVRRAHRPKSGGHAEPVIGPVKGQTRWLCPSYGFGFKWPRRALAGYNLQERDERTVMPVEEPLGEKITAQSDPETSFYIAATGPENRIRRTLKHDDTFLLIDAHGDIGASAGASDGLFHRDTRYLSHFEIRVDGLQLLLLGSNMREDNAIFTADLTNPDIFSSEGIVVLEKDSLHINRSIFLWRDTAFQRLVLRNHSAKSLNLLLSINFTADFADIFEVRGMRRSRRGTFSNRVNSPNEVVLRYLGLDDFVRHTSIYFDPAPARLSEREAMYRMALSSHQSIALCVTVRCNPATPQPAPFGRSLLCAHRELRRAAQGAAVVHTSNPLFDSLLRRSMADLAMLKTMTPQGPYPYAGTPWYSTTFGRDGLITALQMLWIDPRIARGVLLRLATLQAKAIDTTLDAEPGKILHEVRFGEMAALGEVPFGLYYGSVDSTPLFVLLAGLYFERTGDVKALTELWPAIEAALSWIDGPADRDRDGFIEYSRANECGLINQGWKDSGDAVFHADGRLAAGPIALAEVQGYVFAAKRLIARCARRLGHLDRADVLEAESGQLAENFENAFWREDLQTYALALDGAKEPCCVRTSNAGQVLFTGIARPDHAATVATTLLAPDLFSGWGIRTVSRREVRYNPMSYHNGSVWPHDNALIAVGLARIGAKAAVDRIFNGLFDAAIHMDLHRLPELFCGFQRARDRGPTRYPVACSPQAWASATPFCLLQASLGLELDPAQAQLRLRNPRLPKFLDQVTIQNLQIGESSADIAVQRDGETVSVSVLKAVGSIQVSVLVS
jgi:glycogen debranching enzyme